MKKFLSLLIFTLIFSSCEDVSRDGIEDLPVDQQNYLRNLEKQACLDETQKDIDGFKEDVNRYQDLERGNRYDFSRKKASTEISTSKIYVWKVTGSNLFLLIVNPDQSGNSKHQFVKITKTDNIKILEDIQQKLCDHVLYKDFLGDTSGSKINVKLKTEETSTVPNKFKVTTTYTYVSNKIPFFANYSYNQSKTEYKPNDDATGKKENFSGVLSALKDGEDFPSESNQYTEYPEKEYCTVKFTGSNVYTIPYQLECTSDPNAGPTGWATPGAEL